MNQKRSPIALVAASIVMILLVVAMYTLSTRRPKPKAVITQNSVQEETGIPVETTPIRVKTVDDALSVTGQLAAESTVSLSTKVPGKVLRVAAREGSSVRQGEVVIQLDDADARKALQQAEAGVQQAQAGVQVARARLTSARTAAKVGDTQSLTAVAGARAGLKSAESRLEAVRTGARRQERIQSQNAVNIAKANFDKAQSDYNRYQGLYTQGAIAASTLDMYKTSLDVAKANYNNAQQSASLVEEGARTEDVSQAEAGVQQAREALRSAEAAQATSINRQEDVRSALAGVQQAIAQVASARAGVAIAQQNVANFQIRAPRSGSVTLRNVEPGQFVQPGVSLLTIVDLSTVYLQADVSETDVERVKPGMPVNVHVDAFASRNWRGSVQSVVASADAAARTFTARVVVGNPDHTLRPNMFARAEIVTGRVTNAMLVPKEAVIQRDGKTAVARVDDGKAEIVPVSTGITEGDRMVVRSAQLRSTDRIVTSGQQNLTTGQKITE
ncbi:MAG TPA: efflux RND transporter periplasmic adaptor subunit [Armatimonadota bacterium]|jgi:RND family efflux transporter MFP subunit